MSFINIGSVSKAEDRQYDSGLRTYMVGVFKHMAIALFITALIAFFIASSPGLLMFVVGTPIGMSAMLVSIAIPIMFGFRIQSMSFTSARMCLWVYAALQGIGLSYLALVYTGESIAKAFLITSATFGSMALYGNTTKKDLSSWSSFLMMGLIGVIVASLVNLFMWSNMLGFVISVAAIILFTALTAYDTQRIKEMYYMVGGDYEMASKLGIFGALTLYLDFINTFIYMLRFVGDKRE